MQLSHFSAQIQAKASSVAVLRAEASSVLTALQRLQSDLTVRSADQQLATLICLKLQNLTSNWLFLSNSALSKLKATRKAQHRKVNKHRKRVEFLEKQQAAKEKEWQVSLARMLYCCSEDLERKEAFVSSALQRCARAREALTEQLSEAEAGLTGWKDSTQAGKCTCRSRDLEQSGSLLPCATDLKAAFSWLKRQQLLGSVRVI